MRNTIFLFLFLGLTPMSSQAQVGFDSVYHFIPTHAEDLHALVVDNDTLVVMRAGFDTLVNKWGINLLKMDTFGNVIFSQMLSDSMGSHIVSQWGNKLIKTADGGYAYGASYAHNPDCKECIFFVKYKHSGDVDFIRYYETPDTNALIFAVNNLLQLDDGGYFLFSFYEPDDGENIPRLIRIDAQGNELWHRDYAAGDTSVAFLDVLSLSSNEIVVSGYKYKFAPSYIYIFAKPYIFKMDTTGNIIHEVFDDADSLLSASFVATDDGGYLQTVEKITQFDPYYKSIAGIRKLDSNFHQEWIRYMDPYPNVTGMAYLDIVQTTDGHYVASGGRGFAGTDKPAMHIKIKEDGTVLWERFDFSHYGNTKGIKAYARASAVLSSGSIVSVGSTRITEPYGYSEKGWLIKISPGGCVYETDTLDCWAGATVVDIKKPPPSQEIQVYPNPAGDELTIQLTGDLHQKAYVYFYDVTGRLLRKQRLDSAYNVLTISDLPKGMIFYTINSTEGVLWHGKLVVDR